MRKLCPILVVVCSDYADMRIFALIMVPVYNCALLEGEQFIHILIDASPLHPYALSLQNLDAEKPYTGSLHCAATTLQSSRMVLHQQVAILLFIYIL
jgi:hypothetical protein